MEEFPATVPLDAVNSSSDETEKNAHSNENKNEELPATLVVDELRSENSEESHRNDDNSADIKANDKISSAVLDAPNNDTDSITKDSQPTIAADTNSDEKASSERSKPESKSESTQQTIVDTNCTDSNIDTNAKPQSNTDTIDDKKDAQPTTTVDIEMKENNTTLPPNNSAEVSMQIDDSINPNNTELKQAIISPTDNSEASLPESKTPKSEPQSSIGNDPPSDTQPTQTNTIVSAVAAVSAVASVDPIPQNTSIEAVAKNIDEANVTTNDSIVDDTVTDITAVATAASTSATGGGSVVEEDDAMELDQVCGVCASDESWPEDQLVFCDGCDVPVHQVCYAVAAVPEGDWYCKPCDAQVKSSKTRPSRKKWWGIKVKCAICKTKFKNSRIAFTSVKQTSKSDMKWAHVVCAQFVSETWFGDDLLNDVENISGIYPKRFGDKCQYCSRQKGAKVFCSIVGCSAVFHASCGLLNDCMLTDLSSINDEYANRVVYCPQHTPEMINKNGIHSAIELLRMSQNLSKNMNQNNLGWGATWDEHTREMDRQRDYRHAMGYDDAQSDSPTTDRPKKRKKTKRKKKKSHISSPKRTLSDSNDPSFVSSGGETGTTPVRSKESADNSGEKRNGMTRSTKSRRKRRILSDTSISTLSTVPTSSTASILPNPITASDKERNRPRRGLPRIATGESSKSATDTTTNNKGVSPSSKVVIRRHSFFGGTKKMSPVKRKQPDANISSGNESGGTSVVAPPDLEEVQQTKSEPPTKKRRMNDSSAKSTAVASSPIKPAPDTEPMIPKRKQLGFRRRNHASPPTNTAVTTIPVTTPNMATNGRKPSVPSITKPIASHDNSDIGSIPVDTGPRVARVRTVTMRGRGRGRAPNYRRSYTGDQHPSSMPRYVSGSGYSSSNSTPIHTSQTAIHGTTAVMPGEEPFPLRDNTLWTTFMKQDSERNWPDFRISFVWLAGCKLDKWPFTNVQMKQCLASEHPIDFDKCANYVNQIRLGGSKAHLSHHWMVCEIHPYAQSDVDPYGMFCNKFKDERRVSCSKLLSSDNGEILFYLIPPNEAVISERALQDVFKTVPPSDVMWAVIFVQNFTEADRKQIAAQMPKKNANKRLNNADPRQRKKKSITNPEKAVVLTTPSNRERSADVINMPMDLSSAIEELEKMTNKTT